MNASCRLFLKAPETRQHFISECSFLHTERQNYIEKLHNNQAIQNTPNLQLHNPEFLTQLTLDASAVLRKEQIDKDTWGLLELQSRDYLCKINSP